jgi:PAS domain S-box-containing protein
MDEQLSQARVWHGVFWFAGVVMILTGGARIHSDNRALVESEGRFRQIAANLDLALILSSPDHREYRYVSPAYERIWGRSCESLYEDPDAWLDAVVEEDRKSVTDVALARPVKEPYTMEYRIKRTDGAVRWIREKGFPIVGYIGETVALAGVAEDITALKEREGQREVMAAMLRHDIKTPMTIISGNVDILLEEFGSRLPDDAHGMLKSIVTNTGFLSHMVDDLSVMFTLRSPDMKLNMSHEDARDIVVEVRASTAELARMNGLTLTLAADEDAGRVEVDRTLIQRAVTNLVLNAINYTPEGGVVTLGAKKGKGGQAVIYVMDTGPGIPKNESGRVFERYYRSPNVKGTRGTGLGLPIVKAVAEAHGGWVELDSEPGRGSKFSIFLPAG